MFKKINFGKSAGEEESSEYPALLTDGFYNFNNSLEKISNESYFLVQGFKGCGKSSIAEKICIENKSKPNFFTELIYLRDFPFKRFSEIYPSKEADEVKFPKSWRYLLLSKILNNIIKSMKSNQWSDEDKPIRESIDKLKSLGLISSGDINHLTLDASKKAFKINLANVVQYKNENIEHNDTYIFFDNLITILTEVIEKTKIGGIILIDGLDDVILNNRLQLKTLSALIFETGFLNRFFKKGNLNIKICILIRVDLYERLPSGNKNKSARDSSILMNWYNDVMDHEQTHLVKAANIRTKLSLGTGYSLSDFFPEEISLSYNTNKNTISFLLDHTRHTPRDFFQLLKSIQNHYNPSIPNAKISNDEILKGIREYSYDYFLPEIRDEISGYIDEEIFEYFLTSISKIKQREFKYETLLENFHSNGEEIKKLNDLLKTLFKCSAIGHKFSDNKYEYVFRNKYAKFDREKTICLHRGMWKALNL
ncbi:TPA: hypothetical protein JD656_RS00865 [Morganella morganii]|nr:hypothetical protein [Morganella morganii]